MHSPIPVSHPGPLVRSFYELPAEKICLLYGESSIFRLATFVVASGLLHDEIVVVIDGCNRFDLHGILRIARARRANLDRVLENVRISRGFTCYQMEAVITGMLPHLLTTVNARAVVILGLLDTFYDEQAPLRDTRQMIERIFTSFHSLRSRGVSLFLAQKEWNVQPAERNILFKRLKEEMDHLYYIPPVIPQIQASASADRFRIPSSSTQ